MRAVIMAGGEGTRLRPFTQSIPKPLLPIGRKPVAQIIVERLRDCGITDITMTLEYGADLIRAYFQNGSQFGVKISYYQEPRKMGTAGCLTHLPGFGKPGQRDQEPFLVTNGDILTNLDYAEFLHSHAVSEAIMTVATRSGQIDIPYGVLKIENEQILSVEEKPSINYVFNAGMYALTPSALDHIPSHPDAPAFPMTDLITGLVAEGKVVRSYQVPGLWFDLARVSDFEAALTELEANYPELL